MTAIKLEGKEIEAPDYARPEGVPAEFNEHAKLMMDMLVLAFQTDSTRIATFMMTNAGSNRPYPQIEVSDGHHDLSHHQNDGEKQKKIAKINAYHIQQFDYLLTRLRQVKEGDGTLLDNCMLMYGSGLSDGNRHNHDDLPILLAGRAGGAFKPGRHVRFADKTPSLQPVCQHARNHGYRRRQVQRFQRQANRAGLSDCRTSRHYHLG